MSYGATIFNVMIASPGDVHVERELARDIIHEWNSIHAASRHVALMPIGWETHSHPSMEDRPQGVLNKQILESADLLVAVFWTRIGTPTGVAVSGSVEEIEHHVKSGKPAMLYFSEAPVRLDSVDNDQYQRLVQFKSEIKSRGLYETYDAPSNFGDKFRRQLATKVNTDKYFASNAQPLGEKATFAAVVEEAARKGPSLSKEAQELLIEASLDRGGHILLSHFIGGTEIQTNGKQFVKGKEGRARATWEGALNELVTLDLVRDLGKGSVFRMTREGYDVAELLRN